MSIERASSGRLKLYFYLKDLPLEYKIDYQDVAYYLADKRSNYIYTKGVFYGYKLIECRYLGQDEKSKCLLFRYLAIDDSDLKNYFVFKVRVKQKDNERNFNAIVNSKTFLVEDDSYLIATKCYKDSEFIWIKKTDMQTSKYKSIKFILCSL